MKRSLRSTSQIFRAALVALALVVASLISSPVQAYATDSGSQSMYRLYNPYSGEHFYTASTTERDHLKTVGWRYEGVGWTAPKTSSTPVYRLYNRYAGDHHYTTSASERDMLVAAGWTYEGVGWYSSDAKEAPLYRQYNPYASTGTHNYTTSKGENDKLVSIGWRAEGIAWYGLASSSDSGTDDTSTLTLSYRAHSQNKGWLSWTSDGGTAGTTGQSLRAEAFQAKVSGGSISGGITYRAHVQDTGWQSWVADGATAGTTGQSLRVEAVQIALTGDLANSYDIYYRVHAANLGWMGWTKNGETAGTTNLSIPIEAIQIKLVAKGSAAPTSSDTKVASPSASASTLSYRTRATNSSWYAYQATGGVSGNASSGSLDQLQATITNNGISGGISYTAHVANVGWTSAVSNGATIGTAGKQIEAITVSLTGQAASVYDVYYRVNSEGHGWMGWAKNGEKAGTQGMSQAVRAVQITLVVKGGSAPGTTTKAFLTPSCVYVDAGHGWSSGTWDSGALGNGYKEANLTADLAKRVCDYLKSYGVNYYSNYGSTQATGLNYDKRQKDAYDRGCTMLVSIHFNSFNGSATGYESYIHSKHAPAGSSTIQSILMNHLATAFSGTTVKNRGSKSAKLAVTSTYVPATLLEICFIDNASDMKVYQAKKDTIAKQIALGIVECADRGF